MDGLSPSTINVRLSAARKLILEARKMGLLTHEDAANLTDVPNIVQKGTRMGNWLTREQAKEILRIPIGRPTRANGITSCWHCWSAAPSAGRSLRP